MSKLYNNLVQEYYHYEKEKRDLTQEYKKIMTKLDLVEDMLIGLNDILCKNGKHIYEHFEEGEPQEGSDTDEMSEVRSRHDRCR